MGLIKREKWCQLRQRDFDQAARLRKLLIKILSKMDSGRDRDILDKGLGAFDRLVLSGRNSYQTPSSSKRLPQHIRTVIEDAGGQRITQLQLLDRLRLQWPKYLDVPNFSTRVGVTCGRMRKEPPLWLGFEKDWSGRWTYWNKKVLPYTPVKKRNVVFIDDMELHWQLMEVLSDQLYKRRGTYSEMKKKMFLRWPKYRKRKYFDKELKEAIAILKKEEPKFGYARRKLDKKKVYWHRKYDIVLKDDILLERR